MNRPKHYYLIPVILVLLFIPDSVLPQEDGSGFKIPDFPKKSLFLAYGEEEGEWLISPIIDFVDVLKKKCAT